VLSSTEKGPSSFIVEKSAPGLEFGRTSQAGDAWVQDLRGTAHGLQDSRRELGRREGEGFEQVKTMLNSSRIVMGALCVGVAQVAYEKAVNYSKERKAFGDPSPIFSLPGRRSLTWSRESARPASSASTPHA